MNEQLLTVEGVSAFTHHSRGVVWQAIREGRLKVFRETRPILISLSDVMEWQKTLEPKISKSELERLYNVERKSVHQIAKQIGVSAMVIHRLMVKYAIPRRSKSEAMKGRKTWNKSPDAYKERCRNIGTGHRGVKMMVSEADRERRRKHIIELNRQPHNEQWRKKQRDTHSGENNYRWNGGSDHYRGENWQEQRRKARKRDHYTCQLCSITELDFGQELDVHHIVPYRQFQDYKEANLLNNLICYCKPCHSIIEHRLEQQISLNSPAKS